MPRPSLLERMGLGRPELRAWAMYDWAASSVQTTIMVAVFPIYFVKVAGAGIAESGATQRLATINSIALLIIALVSPLLGAVSDYRAAKKRFTAIFMGLGVVAVLRVVPGRPRRSGPGLVALHRDHGGGGGELRLLRGAAAAHRGAGRDRPGLGRRLRRRVPGRGRVARVQPGLDPDAGARSDSLQARGSPRARPRCRRGWPSSPSRSGGRCSRFRSSARFRSRGYGSSRTSVPARAPSGWRSCDWGRPSASSGATGRPF